MSSKTLLRPSVPKTPAAAAPELGDIGLLLLLPEQEPRARSAMRACAPLATPISPSISASSACTAASRSTTTRSSAAISGSTSCRPRCSCVKLDFLDGWTQARQRNARYYDQAFAAAGLTSKIQLPFVAPGIATSSTSTLSASPARRTAEAPDRVGRRHGDLLSCAAAPAEVLRASRLQAGRLPRVRARRARDGRDSDLSGAATGQLDYVVATIARFYG